tara:strand:- start:5913 stop:6137 length:225 start_codon:yes stop_codon:yes gene_type:complete
VGGMILMPDMNHKMNRTHAIPMNKPRGESLSGFFDECAFFCLKRFEKDLKISSKLGGSSLKYLSISLITHPQFT